MQTTAGTLTATPSGDPFELEGRVAVITGGGRGLGQAMAVGMARRHCRVLICGRTIRDLAQTVSEIRAAGGEAEFLEADLRAPDVPGRLVDTAVQTWGGLDIVINNAVDPAVGALKDMDLAAIEAAYAANVFAPMMVCRAALPYLAQSQHAAIINVLSVFAWWGGVGSGVYASSKAALLQLTRVMAKEWAEYGVRVNGIAPGPFETTAPIRDEQRTAWLRDHTLLKRIATPEEIVPPILLLASDASNYTTGAVLTVDGGMSV